MTAIFAVTTTLELIAILLIVWGFLHEDKIIDFENKLARAIAINIRNHRRRKAAEQRRRIQAQKQQSSACPVCTQPAPSALPPVKAPAHATGYWVA